MLDILVRSAMVAFVVVHIDKNGFNKYSTNTVVGDIIITETPGVAQAVCGSFNFMSKHACALKISGYKTVISEAYVVYCIIVAID